VLRSTGRGSVGDECGHEEEIGKACAMGRCSESKYIGTPVLLWNLLQRQKAVVKPNWLRDSISEGHALPCGKYAALEDLVDETIINCPDGDDCKGCEKCRSERPSSSSSAPSESTYELGSGSKARHSPPYDVVSRTGVSLKPFSAPTSPKAKFNASYACERATPLVCPNEDLVKALAVIRKSRELESEGRSQLSYQRAIAVSASFAI
jgi:DNA polymerase mu